MLFICPVISSPGSACGSRISIPTTQSVGASEYAEKNHLGGVTHELHAYEFPTYHYLQQADDANAKRVLDNTEPMAAHLHSIPDLANDGMAPLSPMQK
jgi:hypothetical protein